MQEPQCASRSSLIARASCALPLLLTTATLLPHAAMAGSRPLLKEIIVTAQRRQQNIQDVGIVITALSGHDLRAAEINSVQQLAHQTPGLQIEDPGTPANTTITIRGVGTRDIGPNAEGTVSL